MSIINNDKGDDRGMFVISLDFELLWGVWDVTTMEKYGDNIKGVRRVIPRLLDLFGRYGIKVTFSTVGFLFAKNKDELFSSLPDIKPGYSNHAYDVYTRELNAIGTDETDDPYHFCYSLFEQVKQSHHEIGTHTFSHYFCLEDGQNEMEFDADIKAAISIAETKGIKLNSIVFPRNQINPEYLTVLKNNHITVYRGSPSSWIYKPRKFGSETLFIRLLRLLDTYLPISGHTTHKLRKENDNLINIPASRFLKPYNPSFAWLENLKIRRLKNEMSKAAQQGELYHLWWHPHNFGVNLEENMNNLTALLDHYSALNKKYGFANATMKEAAGL